ncbi:hypothetical protein EJ04DRAFT_491056 [Polyplosphaeria fusca]|uniref:F-box domain-containing protein n=1 Tax=Polyplosphaeria fusca TaxID=682080 RepID=A0A9P4QXH6_9PLEO|nr:hypothetical protein EJ04DRAFT_491056 [Polyplosphaeria fusca]
MSMAHTLSVEEYQALGKSYYKRKEYAKAIGAFTDAIEAAHTPPLNLYDNRAASHDKLGNYTSAVKDGRSMIKIDKTDIRGYLRTGNVLQKMNKLETALSIYKYSMKNVPIDNRDFKLLQQLHDKLTRQLSPASAVDPLTILPVELVEMIIAFMSFKNMVNCLRVCKGWRTYLIHRPNLWTDLDFSGARKDVSRRFLRDAVNRSEYRVHQIIIHRFPHVDILRNIATACKNLTRVEFLSGGMMHDSLVEIAQCATNLKTFVYRVDITLDAVTQILRFRPTLQHAEFTSITTAGILANWKGPFTNLETLVLNSATTLHPRTLNQALLLRETPSLKFLKLVSWDVSMEGELDLSALPLETLIMKNMAMSIIPILPSSLTHLELHPWTLRIPESSQDLSPAARDSWMNALASRLPKLTKLTLINADNINGQIIAALLLYKPNEHGDSERVADEQTALQSLSIRGGTLNEEVKSFFGAEGLLVMDRLITNELRSLEISAHSIINDDAIETLLSLDSAGLEHIDLSSTNISGASLKMLADKLPRLKSINVNYCAGISNRDAIVYAQGKGITVSWKQMQRPVGGRRIRYG